MWQSAPEQHLGRAVDTLKAPKRLLSETLTAVVDWPG
jgi:hypothetical protein